MKKYSLLLALCFLSVSVSANVFEHKTDLNTIAQNIPQMESIKCKFKQEKIIKNIQKPIISSGDFEFKKGDGVYFYTTYPIQSTTKYTGKNFEEINSIINAISNKNYSKLEKDFDFYYSGDKSNWTLGLKPKNNTAEYLSDITIEGNNYIHKINIIQTNGNKTTLWFTKEDL